MSSPTTIYADKTSDGRLIMVIDIAGTYYLQVYQMYTPGNTLLLISEVWTKADAAITRAKVM